MLPRTSFRARLSDQLSCHLARCGSAMDDDAHWPDAHPHTPPYMPTGGRYTADNGPHPGDDLPDVCSPHSYTHTVHAYMHARGQHTQGAGATPGTADVDMSEQLSTFSRSHHRWGGHLLCLSAFPLRHHSPSLHSGGSAEPEQSLFPHVILCQPSTTASRSALPPTGFGSARHRCSRAESASRGY